MPGRGPAGSRPLSRGSAPGASTTTAASGTVAEPLAERGDLGPAALVEVDARGPAGEHGPGQVR